MKTELQQQFKAYLEQEFRTIAPTKEAKEYRVELYRSMCKQADTWAECGKTDEEVYDLCVRSLGNLQNQLKSLDGERGQNAKLSAKLSKAMLWAAGVLAVMLAVYLTISFTTQEWDKTWLFFVGAAAAGSIVGGAYLFPKFFKKKNLLLSLAAVFLPTSISTAFVHLCTMELVGFGDEWRIYLALPVILLTEAIIIAKGLKSKLVFPMVLALIFGAASLAYAFLGTSEIVDWSPYWLIPAGAALLDMTLVGVKLMKYSKAHMKTLGPSVVNERYYTEWN